jgi:3-oxoacyl-[acyl-carrier protein] reductase
MDLGIRGRAAIVMASSRGLGFACADALAREGVDVTINGRDEAVLRAAVADLRARHEVEVHPVAGDVVREATRDALLASCPAPDMLVTNGGGPSPASYRDWDRERWLGALDANLLAPVLMIRAVLDGMVERRFGRIVNITSAMVKAPVGAMGLSAGARAGLIAAVKGVSREVANANVTINNLCPERFDTARQRQMAELASAVKGISLEAAYDEVRATIPAGRLGEPAEFGDMCAFLCSTRAGYLSGASISLDGAAHTGLW